MIQHDEKHKEVIVSNAKMAFRLNYEHGILLSDILHVHSSKSWLAQPVAPFILTILGQDFSAADFSVVAVPVMKDLARECVSFDLKSPAPWALTARVSLLSQPEYSWILLYQMGANGQRTAPRKCSCTFLGLSSSAPPMESGISLPSRKPDLMALL